MKKTFIIACGGTGGHLSPGIALAEELIERGDRCILIISQKKVDQKLCQAYPHISFIQIPGIGFPRQIFRIPKFFFLQLKSFLKSFHLLMTSKAEAVVGFGGFTNAGITIAAFLLKKPCFLHEANQKVGKAIRLLSAFSSRLYIPEGVSYKSILSKRIKHCGFPLRKEIQKINKNIARKELDIPDKSKLIVITGGSQGATVFNKWALDNFETLAIHNINLLCLTGLGHQPQTIKKQHKNHITKVMFIPFSHNMNIIYSAADLVISRAGAGTIAELTKCETPSILVPYPHAADNHQLANAIFFEERGGCLVIEQKKMYTLLDETLRLLADTDLLENMRYNLHQLNGRNPTYMLADDLQCCAKKIKDKFYDEDMR